jgi:hypothetical protein
MSWRSRAAGLGSRSLAWLTGCPWLLRPCACRGRSGASSARPCPPRYQLRTSRRLSRLGSRIERITVGRAGARPRRRKSICWSITSRPGQTRRTRQRPYAARDPVADQTVRLWCEAIARCWRRVVRLWPAHFVTRDYRRRARRLPVPRRRTPSDAHGMATSRSPSRTYRVDRGRSRSSARRPRCRAARRSVRSPQGLAHVGSEWQRPHGQAALKFDSYGRGGEQSSLRDANGSFTRKPRIRRRAVGNSCPTRNRS